MELCCSVCVCQHIRDHHHLALAGELLPAGDTAAPASVGVCGEGVSSMGECGDQDTVTERGADMCHTEASVSVSRILAHLGPVL